MCYLPMGSYFSILNLGSGCRSGLPRGIIRYELYGGTNNAVLNFCPNWSLFLCSVTYTKDVTQKLADVKMTNIDYATAEERICSNSKHKTV